MAKTIVNGATVKFGPVRLSHVHLLRAYAYKEGDPKKYSCVPLIRKDDKEKLDALRKAMDFAYEQAVSDKWKGKRPPFENYPPLIDGDSLNKNGEERGDECRGHYILNAKCSTRPGVIDKAGVQIFDEEEVYSGMWAYVSLTFFGYDNNGRGVATGLNNVKKYKDDDKFGGRVSAQADFACFDDEEDEDL